MQRDIRGTGLYMEAEALFTAIHQPGSGQLSDAAEICASPVKAEAVFSGSMIAALEGEVPTRICHIDLQTGVRRVLTFGPHTDRLPKYSPDGKQVAFLSDRRRPGEFQLHLLDPVSGAARAAPSVNGWIEYLHWSADGTQILLGVAGRGADRSGVQGAITSQESSEGLPNWMPTVDSGARPMQWRRLSVYELETETVREVPTEGLNVWEGVWCGIHSFAAVVSSNPEEGHWYGAELRLIDSATGSTRVLYRPGDQLGWPAASPSGRLLAVVEAICSDRWIVAGDLRIIETASGAVQRIPNLGFDITYTEWRSERIVLLAGHREFASVVGVYDVVLREFTEAWSSEETTTGSPYMCVSGLNDSGDCVLIGESFGRAPEVALVQGGHYRSVSSFDVGYRAVAGEIIRAVERVTWTAPDGLDIQGWLLRPHAQGPHPVVMGVHGGPIWQLRPMWLGRRGMQFLMLLEQGYAVFFPNPRGSSGRGQAFARAVVGDMGGTDTHDYLSGLDYLVEQGWADPGRLGVTGGSYGGFMTAWLITQDARFAAAVPVSPATNQVSEHLVSNIPHFVKLFLADHYNNPGGKYFDRSPVMHAHKAKIPTLNICGALDRCTPPQEAIQFHRALLENGVDSALLIYPEEGHGIRKLPAVIDYVARVVGWFIAHMPATAAP